MSGSPTDVALALNECDREPIHIPGQIQPFGQLIVCDQANWVVTHVSANSASLGFEPRAALGQPLKSLIGGDNFHVLVNALASSPLPQLPGRVFDVDLGPMGRVNCAVHAYQGRTLVEIEPCFVAYDAAAPLTIVRAMLARMQAAQNVHEACSIAAEQIRVLIDFDRVMVYRFLEDGSGYVAAESRLPSAPSFLGHHYPASDIPKQARALYIKNWIRQITDVWADQVPIVATAAASAVPLDMTYCSLRSVSPIHVEYLKNMDVTASLSISVVVAGELWGLIACHSGQARVVPPDVRIAAELFAQSFSLQVQTMTRADAAVLLRDARRDIDRIVSKLPPGTSLAESLEPHLGKLAELMSSHGASLIVDHKLVQWGSTPTDAETRRLAEWLGKGRHDPFVTHELGAHFPTSSAVDGGVSGLMAVPLSHDGTNYVMLFRRELVQTINWAGKPEKTVTEAEPDRLSPRKSFEIWQEMVRGQSQPWESHDCLIAEALRTALLEIVLKYSELVSQERSKAESQQRIHAAELNHRIKNALALIGALVSQSGTQQGTLASYVADLRGRIESLARANDLAAKTGPIALRTLLETELGPFVGPNAERLIIQGPDLWLAGEAASTVALVVHEMTTNAAKHGALSNPQGRVEVRWRRSPDGGCTINWKERDGPRISGVQQDSFGSFLIKNQIPFELAGRSELRLSPKGAEIRLFLPAACILVMAPKGERQPAKRDPDQALGKLLGAAKVLVVEDSLILAHEVERVLRDNGVRDVIVRGALGPALKAAALPDIGAAVLDINLKGMSSYAVADLLTERHVPLIFVTGYGSDAEMPVRFGNAGVIAKPARAADMVKALATAVRAARRRPAD